MPCLKAGHLPCAGHILAVSVWLGNRWRSRWSRWPSGSRRWASKSATTRTFAGMDANYDPMLLRMASVADLIKVSEQDLRGLFRTDNEAGALLRLRAMNPAAACLYTRGAEGATLSVGEQSWRATPPQFTVVDTVGAGDCSLAGLLCSLMREPGVGWDVHLRASVVAGTGACLAAGATPPSAETFARLVNEVKVSVCWFGLIRRSVAAGVATKKPHCAAFLGSSLRSALRYCIGK